MQTTQRIAIFIILLLLLFSVDFNAGQTETLDIMPPIAFADDGEACGEFVQQVFFDVSRYCSELDNNQACLGYKGAKATNNADFTSVGDTLELSATQKFETQVIDPASDTYGVVVMNIQANYHADTSRHVVLLALGEASIENAVASNWQVTPANTTEVSALEATSVYLTPGMDAAIIGKLSLGDVVIADGVSPDGNWARIAYQGTTAWVTLDDVALDTSALAVLSANALTPMQNLNIRTGLSNTCSAAPPSAIVLQSATDEPVSMVVNGISIDFGSTVFVHNIDNNTLRIVTGEGQSILFAGTTQEVVIPTGTSVDIPLDENGMALHSWTNWQISVEEIDAFAPVEYLSATVLNEPYKSPSIFQQSGNGDPPPVVVPPSGGPPENPPAPSDRPPFPTPDRDPFLGENLDDGTVFDGLAIGGPACSDDSLLFHSNRDYDWDVYRLRTGVEVVNISRGVGSQEIHPTYSQDREWVAFTSTRVDNIDFDDSNWEIYVADKNGENQQRVTYNTGYDMNPSWGPAGWLVFESNRDENWELYAVNLENGRDATRLTENDFDDVNPFWIPGTNEIVYQSNEDGDWEIYQLNIVTSEVEQLTDNEVNDQLPIVSHDTNQLAWVQENDFGTYDLWLMDMETGNVEQLTDTGTDIAGHVFAPDDSFIAYHTELDGDYDVFVVDLTEKLEDDTYFIKNISDNQNDALNDDFEDKAPTFRCDSPIVIYHSDQLDDDFELYQVDPMPLRDTTFVRSTRLTFFDEALDIFAEGNPRVEFNSRTEAFPDMD